RLTWVALKSAGAQSGERQNPYIGHLALQSAGAQFGKTQNPYTGHNTGNTNMDQYEDRVKTLILGNTNMDKYKDRINTLILVSTLITTVTFAAGFTLPGGTNSSHPGQGMAVMLNHIWFKLFIFCNTISMYGAISATLILIWAQLGDITLALLALKVASPLLGVTLATLSGAFLAGVHLVISDLSWLATTFLVLCVISILMLLLLYTILWLPSSSSNPMAWLVEKDETEDIN
ncbi:Protein ACCELERATED CELL DEATH 6, partial [Mucuna pruriens]